MVSASIRAGSRRRSRRRRKVSWSAYGKAIEDMHCYKKRRSRQQKTVKKIENRTKNCYRERVPSTESERLHQKFNTLYIYIFLFALKFETYKFSDSLSANPGARFQSSRPKTPPPSCCIVFSHLQTIVTTFCLKFKSTHFFTKRLIL